MAPSKPEPITHEEFNTAIVSPESLVAAVHDEPFRWQLFIQNAAQAASQVEILQSQIQALEDSDARASQYYEETQSLKNKNRDLLEATNALQQRLLNGFTPLSTPPSTPATKLSPKHPDPEIFEGDKDKLEIWIMQMNAKMQRNADHFVFEGQDAKQNEMSYVLSRLGNEPAGHVQPYVDLDSAKINLESWRKIIDFMKLAYGDPDPQGSARRKLINLYQTNKKFSVFWAEFHRLAQKAGMNAETILEYLKDRLSNEIKDRLVSIDEGSMTLEPFVKMVQNIATKLEILKEQDNRRSNRFNNNNTTNPINTTATPKPPTPPKPFTTHVQPFANNSSTATGAHPGPMDVSSSVRRGPLSQEEKDRRTREGLCKYCGEPGHFARDHSNGTLAAKQKTYNVKMASLQTTSYRPEQTENEESSSQVALEDHVKKI